MTQCNYIYASGLRIKEGDGVVELDGKTLRVVRDGSGQSRPDLPLDGFIRSDGSITLSDLKAELSRRGDSAIDIHVSQWARPLAGGPIVSFSVALDPDAAMGRQGREGDFRGAAEKMTPYGRTSAALYQLKTLPYSNKQSGSETADRLRFAIEEAGGLGEALPYLDERFALHADKDLLDETFKFAGSGPYDRTAHFIRIAGPLVADPSRVNDKDFERMANYFRGGGWQQTDDGHKFVNSAFERMDDYNLHDILYEALTDDRRRAAYLELITDPVRLSRITTWYNPQRMTAEGVNSPGHKVEFLSRVARIVSEQFVTTSEPKFTGDPAADGREWSRRAEPKRTPTSGVIPPSLVWKLPGMF